MNSCLYVGRVRHRRRVPAPHAFRYSLFMVYLDLAELPSLFDGRWLWSADRPAIARFRRREHLGDPSVPLDAAVRSLVLERTGRRPEGPIRLLTHLAYFGYGFNPVSFYYCYDRTGSRLETIVAELNNTPWGEQHPHVLAETMNEGTDHLRRFRFWKEFHVSPFMEMDVIYDWRFTPPGRHLAVHMTNVKDGRAIFDATLALERREITGASLAGALARFPFMTARVVTAIYWQALRLRLKRTPFHPHPGDLKRRAPGSAA